MRDLATMPASPLKTRLIPPLRFAQVETSLYRSAYPVPVNYPFLCTLRLKTLLTLSREKTKEMPEFCKR